ncbi:MAG TPA: AIR synthase-related protein, partial [Chthoniobacterales bacterium]
EELLRTHKNYQPALARVPNGKLKGLAHITGGGLLDNLPRILPEDCDAVIETGSWKVPLIFQILQGRGHVPADEMYQVFNMGIGIAAIVAPNDATAVGAQLRAKKIGRIEGGRGVVRLAG